jgi:hypothetical protein
MANQARSRLFNCPYCGADYHLIKAWPDPKGRTAMLYALSAVLSSTRAKAATFSNIFC